MQWNKKLLTIFFQNKIIKTQFTLRSLSSFHSIDTKLLTTFFLNKITIRKLGLLTKDSPVFIALTHECVTVDACPFLLFCWIVNAMETGDIYINNDNLITCYTDNIEEIMSITSQFT